MNCSASSGKLHDYVDGELDAHEARAFALHLTQCAACRAELESLRALLAEAGRLPREIAPSRELWGEIAAKLVEPAGSSPLPVAWDRGPSAIGTPGSAVRGSLLHWLAPLAVAAAIVFLATAAERITAGRDHGPGWTVANVAGKPRVDTVAFTREARLRVGQWLETDAASRAKVSVGSLGEVTVDPNSRLRVTGVAATDHRVELARGTLHALIWAPPRLFFVDTPAATAIDLGCAYTLAVDDHGDGELQVTFGYVALEHQGRESLVPAGARCRMRRGAGPGTPFAADASAALRAAVHGFDSEPAAAAASLRTILEQAGPDDSVTLWHLLARTEGSARAEVFDVLSRHHVPPPGVTRAGILEGDNAMRRAWGEALGFSSFGPPRP